MEISGAEYIYIHYIMYIYKYLHVYMGISNLYIQYIYISIYTQSRNPQFFFVNLQTQHSTSQHLENNRSLPFGRVRAASELADGCFLHQMTCNMVNQNWEVHTQKSPPNINLMDVWWKSRSFSIFVLGLFKLWFKCSQCQVFTTCASVKSWTESDEKKEDANPSG